MPDWSSGWGKKTVLVLFVGRKPHDVPGYPRGAAGFFTGGATSAGVSASARRICLLLLAVKLLLSSCHRTLSLLMALEFEWGSFQTFPDLTGVVAFLNILQTCWLVLQG
jgi:hypothetical protein